MRKPIERRALLLCQAGTESKPAAKSRKQSLSRQILTALGLSAALTCLPVATAMAQGSIAGDAKPAVISFMASEVLLLDVEKVGDRLVAVGSRGHIVYSDDQGLTWIQAPVPTRQLLTAVHFVDEKNGWAVGHDSLILHTADAGETWEQQYRDPALEESRDEQEGGLLERPLMDVWFRDVNTGFAAGAYGLFLRTDDGGKTWEDMTFDVDNENGYHYNAITEVADTGLFMVGELGTMYRSPDYGDTWETLTDLPYDGSFFGATGTGEAGVVLAWGLRGNMFRSEDFGDTWEQVSLNTPNNGPLESTLSSGSLSEDGQIVVVGIGGVVLTSDDRGRTFNVAIRSDRVALSTGIFLEDGSVLLIGQRGAVKAGENGLTAAP
ncbi:YCF48-related protein [Halopseudomonas laoshanensis]|uniref:YCF48-related protein n=1 Tax=Halopseudomonas laoshanensis TaxID=2268758 RepID=UPI003736D05D